jgi:hypothetical protein
MNLEDDLRRALKRTDPPLDFANRVIAQVQRQQSAGGSAAAAKRRPVMQWFAAAAAVVLVATGGARYYEYQQNLAEAKRVEAEVMLAMQITSEALARVQTTLQERSR